mmetsp:Transcript_23676/g.79886  ORF Transcript_23676/g.79886 Transcript_23676/m.79886 type:complete len:208 (-) Transcript_23676:695-1318(-)
MVSGSIPAGGTRFLASVTLVSLHSPAVTCPRHAVSPPCGNRFKTCSKAATGAGPRPGALSYFVFLHAKPPVPTVCVWGSVAVYIPGPTITSKDNDPVNPLLPLAGHYAFVGVVLCSFVQEVFRLHEVRSKCRIPSECSASRPDAIGEMHSAASLCVKTCFRARRWKSYPPEQSSMAKYTVWNSTSMTTMIARRAFGCWHCSLSCFIT